MEVITQTQIPETKRLAFLPAKLGADCAAFESLVFNFMGQYAQGYSGGYWHFYTLSNGGLYIALDSVERFKVCNPMNYFEKEMSAQAASISVCLYALNALAWKRQSASIIDAYYHLRDFAAEHEEAAQIMAFID